MIATKVAGPGRRNWIRGGRTDVSADAIAEAVVVAVKRLYLLDHDNRPTGTYSFKELLREEKHA